MRLDLVTRIVAAIAGWCLATPTYAIDLLVPQEYASIQAAVDASQNGDRVVLAPGTYNEQVTINAKSITILGSGGPNVTKIDRQNAGGHVFNVIGVSGLPVKFEALTITRCQGDAIRASSSLIEINNVRITFGSRAVLLETNSTLNATALQAIVMSAPGACVYINGPGGIANLSNCNFQDGGNTNGGALYCNSSTGQFTVEDTLFALHTGVNAGSVFLVPGSSGTFTDCVWSNCEGGTASCVFGQGDASVTIVGCTMLQNRGTCFYLENGSLVVRDSLQDGSYNDYRHSLLRNNSGPTTVERVTSRSSWGLVNCNEQGGWIYVGSGSLSVIDCEVTGFRVRGDSGCNGGGLIKAVNSSSPVTIQRSNFSLATSSVDNTSFFKIIGRPVVIEDCTLGFDPGSFLTHHRGTWLENVPSARIERCHFVGHRIVHAVDSVNSTGLNLADCSFSATSPSSDSVYPVIFRGSGHVSQQLIEACTFNRMRQSIRYENNTNGASSLTIRDCRFLDNLRENEASAIWCQGVAPRVEGCLFRSLEYPTIYTNTYAVLGGSFFCGNQGQELNTAILEKGENVFNAPCSIDCDADGLPDAYEIATGIDTDCNDNALPDSCDADVGGDCDKDGALDICEIAAGAPDCNSNGILDTCEPDCDSDGVPNACEIAAGASDCDANGIPDSCQPDCDGDATIDACEIAAGAADCNVNAVPDSCEIAAGTAPDLNSDTVIDTCQPEMQFAGLELEIFPIVNRGLDDLFPAGAVCYRLYARTTQAGSAVVGLFGNPAHPLAINATGGFWQSPYGGDLASAVPCDLSAALPSAKYDSWFTIGLTCALGNSVQNTGMNLGPFNAGGGVNDNDGIIFVNPGAPQSIAGKGKRVLLAQLTTTQAVLPTGTIDVIGRSAGGSATWTAYSQAIPVPALVDCNANGVQDAFDIANATSYDCDQSGVPDTCEYGSASTDCNGNGIPDLCDVTSAFSPDQNGNYIPDECECTGDVDANGRVDVDDIIDVIAAWGTVGDHPADVNNDDVVDTQDLVIVLSGYGDCL